jgi:predicted metalloprotease
MRWDRDYTSADVEDRRAEEGAGLGGGGGGAPVWLIFRLFSLFGWKGVLVGAVIAGAVFVGGQFTHSDDAPAAHHELHSTASENELVHFVEFVFDDVQRSWAAQMPNYRRAHLVLFRRAVKSDCGVSSTAVGPFYCPNDQKVYIDLAFYDELKRKLGAPGDFAQAYVIAHELGHHVQNLLGLFHGSRDSRDSIHIELQADCLAGAWAKDADRRGEVEVGDIDQALNAAKQIGDDTLQKREQGYVQPETWTHGSAAQRSGAFRTGFNGGAAACGVQLPHS